MVQKEGFYQRTDNLWMMEMKMVTTSHRNHLNLNPHYSYYCAYVQIICHYLTVVELGELFSKSLLNKTAFSTVKSRDNAFWLSLQYSAYCMTSVGDVIVRTNAILASSAIRTIDGWVQERSQFQTSIYVFPSQQ